MGRVCIQTNPQQKINLTDNISVMMILNSLILWLFFDIFIVSDDRSRVFGGDLYRKLHKIFD